MSKKKNYHNPYYILLLKALIENEVRHMTKKGKVSIADIENYIINFKPLYGENTTNTIVASTLAERVRKLWSRKSFDFPIETLDMMCELITVNEPVKSWSSFINKYNNHKGAKIGSCLVNMPFFEYADTHPIEHELVLASVNVLVGIKRAERTLLTQMKNSHVNGDLNVLYRELVKIRMESELENKIVCWMFRIHEVTMDGYIVDYSQIDNTPNHKLSTWIKWKYRIFLKLLSLYYLRNSLIYYYFKKGRYYSSLTIIIVISVVLYVVLCWLIYTKRL